MMNSYFYQSLDQNNNEQEPDIPDLKILEKVYNKKLTTCIGQRIFGPVLGNDLQPRPSKECEIFVGHMPCNVYEDTIFTLFSEAGSIYEMRLMVLASGFTKGFCFITYNNLESVDIAIKRFHGYKMIGQFICVYKSLDNRRLRITGIPRHIKKDDVWAQLVNVLDGVIDISIKCKSDGTNIEYVIVKFETHRQALEARRQMWPDKLILCNRPMNIEWVVPKYVSNKSKLVIKGLPPEQNRLQFTEFISTKVSLETVTNTFKKKGYTIGYLEFATVNYAVVAMNFLNGAICQGRKLLVQKYENNPNCDDIFTFDVDSDPTLTTRVFSKQNTMPLNNQNPYSLVLRKTMVESSTLNPNTKPFKSQLTYSLAQTSEVNKSKQDPKTNTMESSIENQSNDINNTKLDLRKTMVKSSSLNPNTKPFKSQLTYSLAQTSEVNKSKQDLKTNTMVQSNDIIKLDLRKTMTESQTLNPNAMPFKSHLIIENSTDNPNFILQNQVTYSPVQSDDIDITEQNGKTIIRSQTVNPNSKSLKIKHIYSLTEVENSKILYNTLGYAIENPNYRPFKNQLVQSNDINNTQHNLMKSQTLNPNSKPFKSRFPCNLAQTSENEFERCYLRPKQLLNNTPPNKPILSSLKATWPPPEVNPSLVYARNKHGHYEVINMIPPKVKSDIPIHPYFRQENYDIPIAHSSAVALYNLTDPCMGQLGYNYLFDKIPYLSYISKKCLLVNENEDIEYLLNREIYDNNDLQN